MKPLTIYPYLLGSTWVFDDARTRLKEEAFVLRASEMISAVVGAKGIPRAAAGIALTFSSDPFEGVDVELRWTRADSPGLGMPGNWYSGRVGSEQMEIWLCPALTLYFMSAPAALYVSVEPLPAGVDPIWIAGPDEQGRRFMGVDSSP